MYSKSSVFVEITKDDNQLDLDTSHGYLKGFTSEIRIAFKWARIIQGFLMIKSNQNENVLRHGVVPDIRTARVHTSNCF